MLFQKATEMHQHAFSLTMMMMCTNLASSSGSAHRLKMGHCIWFDFLQGQGNLLTVANHPDFVH